jgi:hypothetical protein
MSCSCQIRSRQIRLRILTSNPYKLRFNLFLPLDLFDSSIINNLILRHATTTTTSKMTSYTSEISFLLSISKPHPGTQKYIKTSIGGAGNFLPTPTSSSPSSHSSSSSRRPSSTTSVFHTGIGGFGNRHSVEEMGRPDPVNKSIRRERENWHVGIGGAGNRRSSVETSGSEDVVVRSGADRMTEKVFGYFVR